jgi:hypothetical protein
MIGGGMGTLAGLRFQLRLSNAVLVTSSSTKWLAIFRRNGPALRPS